jgi:hypothetical protein
MRVRRATLEALAGLAGATATPVTVICTVEAGAACRLAQGAWDDPALAALAPLLIADLGYKTIEHAPHRQAVVRWTPGGQGWELDLGEGFQIAPIEAWDG